MKWTLLTVITLLTTWTMWSGCSDDSKKSSGSKEKSGADPSEDQETVPATATCKTRRYRPVTELKTCRFSFKVPPDCSAAEGAFATLSDCRESMELETPGDGFVPDTAHTAFAVSTVHLTRILDCDDTALDEWRLEFGTGTSYVRFGVDGELPVSETLSSTSDLLNVQKVEKTGNDEKATTLPSGEILVESQSNGNLTLQVKAELGDGSLLSGTIAGAYYLIPDSLCPAE